MEREITYQKLYDLWYEQREDVLRTYTDTFPERIPLEQNKEFKSIRNAVIQEALKIIPQTQRWNMDGIYLRVEDAPPVFPQMETFNSPYPLHYQEETDDGDDDRLQYFGGDGGMYVSESDYHYFAQTGTTKRYLAGEYIFTRGELASTVYLIKSGRVLVTTSLGDGRMLTFGVLKKGSIFGDGAFADHYLREVDISAVTDVEVIVCETKDLLPLLCENQTLLLMILRHMAELSNEMAHQLVRLAHYDGKQKVVDYILVNAGATSRNR